MMGGWGVIMGWMDEEGGKRGLGGFLQVYVNRTVLTYTVRMLTVLHLWINAEARSALLALARSRASILLLLEQLTCGQ